MMTILRWWAMFCSLVVGAGFLQAYGLFHSLWMADQSKISLIAIGVFTIMTLFVGFITDRIHRVGDITYTKYIHACWYASELLMAIGMTGTLVGFMMMFTSNMSTIDASNIDSIKAVVQHLSIGFPTAVITTLVGLVTSQLLKLQLASLEINLEEADEEYRLLKIRK